MSPALQYASLNEAWGIPPKKSSAPKKPRASPAQDDIMRFVEGYEDVVAPQQPSPPPSPPASEDDWGGVAAPPTSLLTPDVLLYVLSGFFLILMMEQVLQLGARLAAAGARSVRSA